MRSAWMRCCPVWRSGVIDSSRSMKPCAMPPMRRRMGISGSLDLHGYAAARTARQKTFSQSAAGSGAVDHAALSGIATSMNLHLFGGCLIDPATGTDTQADLFISEGQ